ncbi:uncharacterized protein LOC132166366 isoform X2 [Corylus avellana]|uniref:uncharacterized protein LOC132166366 isoform X2 n=1 Tax=Corylus avellana TaxID=13451 RepID=UPI00286A448C|nr:uncharacterized protein LOC132166366 isoform X2 [Corylus avellana]
MCALIQILHSAILELIFTFTRPCSMTMLPTKKPEDDDFPRPKTRPFGEAPPSIVPTIGLRARSWMMEHKPQCQDMWGTYETIHDQTRPLVLLVSTWPVFCSTMEDVVFGLMNITWKMFRRNIIGVVFGLTNMMTRKKFCRTIIIGDVFRL